MQDKWEIWFGFFTFAMRFYRNCLAFCLNKLKIHKTKAMKNICMQEKSILQLILCRAANNFPAGACQIVQSNLFLLRRVPFCQTLFMYYHYKRAPLPLHMMLNMTQVNFYEHLSKCRKSGTHSTAKPVSHFCAYYYCFTSMSYKLYGYLWSWWNYWGLQFSWFSS